VADPADLVREACTLLAKYLPQLERLVAEPSAEGPAPGMTARSAAAPLPGNPQAFNALMTPWEGAPRLEAALKYAVTGYPGLRRGGSAGNVAAALGAIPRLAAGLGEDGEAAAVRILDRWINEARAVPAIDEAQQWRPLRSRPCPHCACYFLKVLLDAAGRPTGHIECFTVGCRDGNGLRAVAAMGTDAHGRPVLAWADGLTETVPDLDG
jgi:hypothetical protein